MKKEMCYKMLFALQIALLPMILSAKLIMPNWCISLFVGLLVAVKLAMVVLKNPGSNYELYLEAIGNVVVVVFTFIVFACYDYVNVVMAVLASVFIVTEEALRVFFYYRPNSQLIDALNFSCEMFIFLSLTAMMIAPFNTTMLEVAAVAIVINTVVLSAIQGYKLVRYYLIKNGKRKKY